MDWKITARAAVDAALGDPDARPRYRVPARRWWQVWKPRWRWVEGVSQNDMRRAYGFEPMRPNHLITQE